MKYIQDIIATFRLRNITPQPELSSVFKGGVPDPARLLGAIIEELNRLDPRDFEASARHDFVVSRSMLGAWVNPGGSNFNGFAASPYTEKLAILLNYYGGEGSGAKARDFSFVSAPDVRRIVERDYRELSRRTFPDGSWKSTVILAGSILEAVLYNALTKDSNASAAAMKSVAAPRKKNGVKDITKDTYDDQWTLNDLIKVACNLKLIPYKDEQAIHEVLREYRNFVHPRLEVQMGITIGEGHATTSKGMLDVILDYLTP
jgi:hypothetical protein